jgi:F0F1-type ATP synthase assembly protein I
MARDDLSWGALLTIGSTSAILLVIGLGAGWLVDHLAGTAPAFLLIGLLLGIVGAVAFVVTKFRTYLKT